MKPKTKGGAILKARRNKVIETLEKQLITGVKPCKEKSNPDYPGPTKLLDKDITRIKKEIETLKQRI